jgi:hypothetical protein
MLRDCSGRIADAQLSPIARLIARLEEPATGRAIAPMSSAEGPAWYGRTALHDGRMLLLAGGGTYE